jgi:hypothetical protein
LLSYIQSIILFLFIPTWRVILTMIAVFLFTRRFQQYAILCVCHRPWRSNYR